MRIVGGQPLSAIRSRSDNSGVLTNHVFFDAIVDMDKRVNRLFSKEVIVGIDDQTVYLRRWKLSLFDFAIMLHKIERPDHDRCHHDHPWWFATLILKGGYVEEIRGRKTIFNRPGNVRFRRARHAHRISALPNGPAWTLAVRGRHRRPWGFFTRVGWLRWDLFLKSGGSANWCE